MRMSRLLLRTLREVPADAEVEGHALLVRGGYVRRLASGVYTFLPLGWRVLHNLERIVRQELDAAGMQEMLMPALSPVELWQQSGRAALFGQDALPAFTVEGRGGTFVLGPTHEEVVTVTVGAEVESYRQLPVTVYQVQTKFRDEARPRFGLLRTRELVMCDAYSFDPDNGSMHASYRSAVNAYVRIFERVSLDATPVEAQSGAIGGDVNHEFMVPSAVGEDHFVRCPSCGYAANVEAAVAGTGGVGIGDGTAEGAPGVTGVTDGGPCPRCGAAVELVRSVEAAHTFQLGLTYSSKMPGATFLDEQGIEAPFWMGCYGMGVSRLMGVVAEEHHDARGLVWPEAVAPFQVHLVAVGAGRAPGVATAVEGLYEALGAAGVEVLYDDRDLSAGVKFADADLLGVPVRVVVGAKGVAQGVAEWRNRRSGEERQVPLGEAAATVAGLTLAAGRVDGAS
jgi:prolyl-tRNA synthetase